MPVSDPDTVSADEIVRLSLIDVMVVIQASEHKIISGLDNTLVIPFCLWGFPVSLN
jgi:hypothetical protein